MRDGTMGKKITPFSLGIGWSLFKLNLQAAMKIGEFED